MRLDRTTSSKIGLGVTVGVLLVGCGSAPTGEPTSPVARPGKADAVTLVSGATINSAHVDPARHYLSHRGIDSLAQVGAMVDAMESVAYRVDGIIASLPADGYISIGEMERMERPDYFATLFPDEQAAFVQLWKLLEMPDQQPIQLANAAALDLTVTNATVPPTKLAFSPSELIESLPEPLQRTARRLQLVYDDDSDADTISFGDLDQGENDPLGRFTPNDVHLFGEIRDELRRRGTSEAEARIEVPAPGDFDHDLVIGDLTLRVTQSVQYEELRRIVPGKYSSSWRIDIDLKHETAISAHLPDGVFALLIDEATDDEQVLQDGQLIAELPAATYLVELWQNGARFATARATLPALEAGKGTVDLDQYADHAFYTAAGDQLLRNPIEARYKYQSSAYSDSYYWARFSYDPTPIPPEPNAVEQSALSHVATLKPAVPAGRYEYTADGVIGTFFIDIYPGGAIYTERQGVRRWMRPFQLDYKKKYDSSFSQGLHRVVIDPSTGELWTHAKDGTAADLRVTLDRLHRI